MHGPLQALPLDETLGKASYMQDVTQQLKGAPCQLMPALASHWHARFATRAQLARDGMVSVWA